MQIARKTGLLRYVVSLWLAAFGLCVGDANADEPVPPQLLIDGRASLAPITALAFSNDGQLLYVAGLDKTVQVWHVEDLRNGEIQATRVQQLFWETGRHHRGELTAMAISPTDGTIALGGESLRAANGDIVLLSPNTGDYEQVLPRARPGQDLNCEDLASVTEPPARTGHISKVLSLDFSSSGRQLLSMSSDGELRVWTIATGESVVLRPAQTRDKTPPFLSAVFVNESLVAYVDRDVVDTPQGQRPIMVIRTCDLGGNNTQTLSGSKAHLWRRLRVDRATGQLWAAGAGAIASWSFPQGAAPTQPVAHRTGGQLVTDIAFPTGREQLITEVDSRSTPILKSRVVRSGTATLQELPVEMTGTPYDCVAACSANGHWLAIGNSASSQLTIVRLDQTNGQLALRRTLHIDHRLIVPKRLAFADDPDAHLLLGMFPNDADPVEQTRRAQAGEASNAIAFDLARGLFFFRPPDTKWLDPLAAPGLSLVRVDDRSRPLRDATRLVIEQNGAARCQIELAGQSTLSTYAWLRDAKQQVQGIAIGTTYPDAGIYVYQLADNNAACELVRYFRDHRSDILSLAQGHQSDVLASTALDGATKTWSLKGIFDTPQAEFARSRAWGMQLAIDGNALQVQQVQEHSIAASRGLSIGDSITQVASATARGLQVTRNPAEMLELLNLPRLNQPRIVTWRRGDETHCAYITPGWEPIVTLHVDQRKEWVAVAPDGTFQTPLLEGDRMLRWLVSKGRDEAPLVVGGAELRKALEDRQLLRSLFGIAFAPPLERPTLSSLSNLPSLRIVSPPLTEVTPVDATGAVTIRAELSQSPPSTFRWLAMSANTPLGRPTRTGPTWAEWEHRPAGPLVDVQVRIEFEGNPLCASLSATSYLRTNARPEKSLRIHFVAAGVDPTGKLQFVEQDAHRLAEHFRQQRGTRVQLASVSELTGQQATTAGILGALQDIESNISARTDLCVLFLSGHGTMYEDRYCFVTHDWRDGNPPADEHRLDTEKLHAALGALPCRCALVLDTCFSDEGANLPPTDDENSGLANAGKEFRDRGIMVFSAVSGENAVALENEATQSGHFTGSLLTGLRGAADGYANAGSPNAQVTIAELVRWVLDDVERATFFQQRPAFAPSELVEDYRTAHEPVDVLRVISEVPAEAVK
ncbi:MAG: caspase family protein [Planctomycetaceae bacterium]|nr:caspase family protein [Planctomycetaceae bacterium]